MRVITTHRTAPDDRQPGVFAAERLGQGGAPETYVVKYPHGLAELGATIRLEFVTLEREGVTNEALLAVVQDRLECFQSGPYACEENAEALSAVIRAQAALQVRTAKRRARGVEGTDKF